MLFFLSYFYFLQVKNLTNNIELILDSLRNSSVVEVNVSCYCSIVFSICGGSIVLKYISIAHFQMFTIFISSFLLDFYYSEICYRVTNWGSAKSGRGFCPLFTNKLDLVQYPLFGSTCKNIIADFDKITLDEATVLKNSKTTTNGDSAGESSSY